MIGVKLVSLPDEHLQEHLCILDEFYSSYRQELNTLQKENILHNYYDLFTHQMLFEDKLFHSYFFKSESLNKTFVIIGSSGFEYVFEAIF